MLLDDLGSNGCLRCEESRGVFLEEVVAKKGMRIRQLNQTGQEKGHAACVCGTKPGGAAGGGTEAGRSSRWGLRSRVEREDVVC